MDVVHKENSACCITADHLCYIYVSTFIFFIIGESSQCEDKQIFNYLWNRLLRCLPSTKVC